VKEFADAMITVPAVFGNMKGRGRAVSFQQPKQHTNLKQVLYELNKEGILESGCLKLCHSTAIQTT
jgi:hypothetical protein